MNRFEWKVAALTLLTAAAAVAAVACYVLRFHDWPVGGPEQWGQLGDYLGGVINPVVGMVTVVLVVMTLRVTRQEAQAARAQIAEQLVYMDRQAVLSDMHKRLEGVMAEWERIMQRRAPKDFQSMNVSSGIPIISNTTVREVFDSSDIRHALFHAPIVESGGRRAGTGRFDAFKVDLVPLIGELDDYCLQYDATAATGHLTYFYRNRVKRVVEMLALAGVMQDSVAERFANNRQR